MCGLLHENVVCSCSNKFINDADSNTLTVIFFNKTIYFYWSAFWLMIIRHTSFVYIIILHFFILLEECYINRVLEI